MKLLKWATIPLIILAFAIIVSHKKPTPAISSLPVTPVQVSVDPRPTLLAQTNQARAGLPQLTENPDLDASAQAKCEDMEARNYWSHNTPDGQKPWVFFKHQYPKMGENLSRNFTPDQTTQAWLDSPEHRKNLLDPDFNQVGFGICNGILGPVIVQHLAT